MNMMDRLSKRAASVSPVCVGLDITPSLLPTHLASKDMSQGEKYLEFNKKIIDASLQNAACFKLQIACYEALGIEGMAAFSSTLKYIHEHGGIAITDAKRGDISSTAAMYAKAHFEGDFESDIITINAYMGEDAVSPYYSYFSEKGKAAFILIKTSNPKSGDFQDVLLKDTDEPLYIRAAQLVSGWGEQFIGESGFSSLGAVVGLTYPAEFKRIRKIMNHTFFLIPGYGAQGGTAQDIGELFNEGVIGVVNSSRGIIGAHLGKTDGADYDLYIHDAVKTMRDSIQQWL